ncbi:hypothetical protein C4D60_Mb07t00900 [Musa balbisiana]|uniref:DUF7866 domain-containing protein n=1 Tax=Musa balbisiana TaxID=52838 RepID=A0A4S8JD76_MUSBA|nr:hypothetical protein C4D60_Mb07t00900 [Musa balbisiana]
MKTRFKSNTVFALEGRFGFCFETTCGVSHAATHSDDGYIPVSSVQHRPVSDVIGSYGSVLAEPFQACSECMCCSGGDRSQCRQMKCCHRIICNQPGKPFGYCSLKPISCSCINCK